MYVICYFLLICDNSKHVVLLSINENLASLQPLQTKHINTHSFIESPHSQSKNKHVNQEQLN